MPRRNLTPRRRTTRPWERLPEPEPSYDDMARALVQRGLASPMILDRSSTPQEGTTA